MKKKLTRSKIVKQLDKLWSTGIHNKFKKCVMCGAIGILHAHHCIVNKGRGGYGVRWLEENGVLLCPVCHLFKIHHGQADKQWLDRYISLLNEIIPLDKQENVVAIGHRINKFSTQELIEMISNGWWNNEKA